MNLQYFDYKYSFPLESGENLAGFRLAYTTYGTLNEQSRVVWICHALTGNADVGDWWGGMVGPGKYFDSGADSPEQNFIVCANVIGSCYGSTGPLSVNPATGEPFYHDFPAVTIRDMVAALDLLRQELGIESIHTCIGGSVGGEQAVEWAILQPDLIQHLIVIAASAVASPWCIAFNEAQRMAIEADPTWRNKSDDAGVAGMKAARAMAMISYRNYDTYGFTQALDNNEQTNDFKAAGYQRYQGEKLAERFNAFTYWVLSKVMDSHNVGRNRGSIPNALGRIKARTLVVGIRSDLLFPPTEQQFLARHISDAAYEEIDSLYGHDGFLIEFRPLAGIIRKWMASRATEQATKTEPASSNR
ncbi:homoserine O-acetyltransferase family protein [Spirosoma utsteinense]|uniref:Homoserine O-acetyltransferase n=1 Tax=Spirosoma utsteinense TaxID=2585773 RepID=A0ABR6WEF6_9BACT|nr:homoserine O-acetyltransferase [Spirosoma utsteinense]MBC3788954.1 homoserine O-acetyltransferase [Spirosoma utsteinense]MBC3794380.1 homoserine O-acetyltransferase [Spirosoma utsteinense]